MTNPSWGPFASIRNPVDRNAAMKAAAIAHVMDRPMTWLKASTRRFTEFFTPWPEWATHSVSRRILYSILMIAIYGGAVLAIMFRWRREQLPILIALLWASVVHIATHAPTRYRLPLDPLLIVLAAGIVVPRLKKFGAQPSPSR